MATVPGTQRVTPRPASIWLLRPCVMQTLREVRDELAGRARQLEVYKQPGQNLGAVMWMAHTSID